MDSPYSYQTAQTRHCVEASVHGLSDYCIDAVTSFTASLTPLTFFLSRGTSSTWKYLKFQKKIVDLEQR